MTSQSEAPVEKPQKNLKKNTEESNLEAEQSKTVFLWLTPTGESDPWDVMEEEGGEMVRLSRARAGEDVEIARLTRTEFALEKEILERARAAEEGWENLVNDLNKGGGEAEKALYKKYKGITLKIGAIQAKLREMDQNGKGDESEEKRAMAYYFTLAETLNQIKADSLAKAEESEEDARLREQAALASIGTSIGYSGLVNLKAEGGEPGSRQELQAYLDLLTENMGDEKAIAIVTGGETLESDVHETAAVIRARLKAGVEKAREILQNKKATIKEIRLMKEELITDFGRLRAVENLPDEEETTQEISDEELTNPALDEVPISTADDEPTSTEPPEMYSPMVAKPGKKDQQIDQLKQSIRSTPAPIPKRRPSTKAQVSYDVTAPEPSGIIAWFKKKTGLGK